MIPAFPLPLRAVSFPSQLSCRANPLCDSQQPRVPSRHPNTRRSLWQMESDLFRTEGGLPPSINKALFSLLLVVLPLPPFSHYSFRPCVGFYVFSLFLHFARLLCPLCLCVFSFPPAIHPWKTSSLANSIFFYEKLAAPLSTCLRFQGSRALSFLNHLLRPLLPIKTGFPARRSNFPQTGLTLPPPQTHAISFSNSWLLPFYALPQQKKFLPLVWEDEVSFLRYTHRSAPLGLKPSQKSIAAPFTTTRFFYFNKTQYFFPFLVLGPRFLLGALEEFPSPPHFFPRQRAFSSSKWLCFFRCEHPLFSSLIANPPLWGAF